jgi:hypothetical protein
MDLFFIFWKTNDVFVNDEAHGINKRNSKRIQQHKKIENNYNTYNQECKQYKWLFRNYNYSGFYGVQRL